MLGCTWVLLSSNTVMFWVRHNAVSLTWFADWLCSCSCTCGLCTGACRCVTFVTTTRRTHHFEASAAWSQRTPMASSRISSTFVTLLPLGSVPKRIWRKCSRRYVYCGGVEVAWWFRFLFTCLGLMVLVYVFHWWSVPVQYYDMMVINDWFMKYLT